LSSASGASDTDLARSAGRDPASGRGGVRGEIGVPARECVIRVSKEKRKHSLRNTKIDKQEVKK
jgi:hypothetical protein